MEDYNAINSFPRPTMPDGFRTLLFSLSKEVLREQPLNIYEFCAEFFGKRLLDRGDSWVDFKERYNKRRREEEEARRRAMPEPITEDTFDERPLDEFTEEEEKAIVKIQAGVRGMLARRGSKSISNAAEERWKHPEAQLRRDLVTASESISFAALEATDGSWEAVQRWLHPAQQLLRDLDTVSEPVTVAELRSRGGSLQDVTAAAPRRVAAMSDPSVGSGRAASELDDAEWPNHDITQHTYLHEMPPVSRGHARVGEKADGTTTCASLEWLSDITRHTYIHEMAPAPPSGHSGETLGGVEECPIASGSLERLSDITRHTYIHEMAGDY